MSGLTWGGRAVAGAIVTVLMINVGWLGGRYALGAYEPSYSVNVVLGQVGQNVTSGSDVKVRGVVIGKVGTISLDKNLRAVAELVLRPQHRLPERSTFVVTGKTLLGEKQVEVVFDGGFDKGPFLAQGATVSDSDRVVEFQDVLAEVAELFEAIPPDDLATVIDEGIGAFDGQGPQIARAIDQGKRATDVGVRTLDDQVPATRDLSLVAETFGTIGKDFNALGRESLRGLPTLSDNQAETRAALDSLRRFARVLDVTLEIERPDFDRMVIEGDSVTRMLFVYRPELGQTLSGLNNYTSQYEHEGYQNENIQGQAAPFQIFIQTGLQAEICPHLPDELRENLPLCNGVDPIDLPDVPDVPVPDLPEPLPDLPDLPDLPRRQGAAKASTPLARLAVPRGITRADQPLRIDVRTLLQQRLTDGEVRP